MGEWVILFLGLNSSNFNIIVKHTIFSDLCGLINNGKISDHEKMASRRFS